MTANVITRRTAGAITAAVVLGTAGPAIAQPIGDHGPVPVAPPATQTHEGTANVLAPYTGREVSDRTANVLAPYDPTPAPRDSATPVAAAQPRASHTGSGSDDLVYVLIGGVGVLVGGLGGVLASSSRRRPAPAGARVAI